MSRVIDAFIAYRILKLLVTPFNKTDAFKLGIIDDKGKVLIKSKQITNQRQRKAYTLLIRFVFNLKKLLAKVGIRGPLGTAAAAALAFFKEENGQNDYVEQVVYKHLKEKGFEFEVNENYGELLRPGTYRVKRNITDLEGDIVINIDEEVIFEGKTDTIMGYDVFKYKNVYLTTEDLYANA
tara:strand:+ start:397 stop:939 length:543 start_codon:yes stop_codon:yes gene_type:complete